jgi:hypothetical protein
LPTPRILVTQCAARHNPANSAEARAMPTEEYAPTIPRNELIKMMNLIHTGKSRTEKSDPGERVVSGECRSGFCFLGSNRLGRGTVTGLAVAHFSQHGQAHLPRD